jgi:CRISPR-associated endonuclease Csn1
VRKPVENLSPAEVERIRDPGIRKIVLESLKKKGIDFGRGKKPDAKKMKEALSRLQMPSGVPIKKVRILKQEQTIQPLRDAPDHQAYVKPGSTHHLCIFEFEEKGKKKREAVFVTMLEATKRQKRGEQIISRQHPERPEAKFVMSLSSREMVLANWKGEQKLLVFKTAASTQGQLYFAEHTDARRSSEQAKFVATANSLDARKVTVDPLGRVRWAND